MTAGFFAPIEPALLSNSRLLRFYSVLPFDMPNSQVWVPVAIAAISTVGRVVVAWIKRDPQLPQQRQPPPVAVNVTIINNNVEVTLCAPASVSSKNAKFSNIN